MKALVIRRWRVIAVLGAVLAIGTVGASVGMIGPIRDASQRGLVARTDIAAIDLEWEDLVPAATVVATLGSGVVSHEQLQDGASPFQPMTDASDIRSDLNGKRVRIPGYMTPLTFEDAEVGEFLLAPYVGACVHVPPPPANQIVYVKVDGTIPVLEMWEPFAAVGTIHTEAQSTELAEVGYTLKLEHLELYEEEPIEVVDDDGNTSTY